MAKYVKVEDVIDLINGLDSLPFEEETRDIVNSLPIYDTDKVIERLKSNAEKMATAKLPHTYYKAIGTKKAEEIIKAGGVQSV